MHLWGNTNKNAEKRFGVKTRSITLHALLPPNVPRVQYIRIALIRGSIELANAADKSLIKSNAAQ